MNSLLYQINWEYVIAILSLLTSLVISIGTIIITNNIAKKNRLVDVITSNRVEWIQKLKDYVSKYISMVSYSYERKIPDDTNGFMNDLLEITAQIKLHLNFKGDADNQIISQLDNINTAFEKFFFLKKTNEGLKEYAISFELIDFYLYQYPDLFKELYGSLLVDPQGNNMDMTSLKRKLNELRTNPDELKIFYKKQVDLIDKDIKNSMQIIKKGHQELLILTQIYLKTEWERVKVEANSGSLTEFNFDEKFEINKKEKNSN